MFVANIIHLCQISPNLQKTSKNNYDNKMKVLLKRNLYIFFIRIASFSQKSYFKLPKYSQFIFCSFSKGRVLYRFLYTTCHDDTNKTTPTSCQMHHLQNFGKIILGNLIVGWGDEVIKEGLVFCIKSIDLRGC